MGQFATICSFDRDNSSDLFRCSSVMSYCGAYHSGYSPTIQITKLRLHYRLAGTENQLILCYLSYSWLQQTIFYTVKLLCSQNAEVYVQD